MWNYKGKLIKDRSDLPEKAIGFVYKIHNWKESKYYIGKKILLNKRTKPPLKGYKESVLNMLKVIGLNTQEAINLQKNGK